MDDIEKKIDQAKQKLFRAKKKYDAAVEELHQLLEERDALHHGLDAGRVTLKEFDFEWEGNAEWDCGSGTVDCRYTVKAKLGESTDGVRGKEVRELETDHPGFSEADVVCALRKSLQQELDSEFEYYCDDDDYYQPVVEDFEAEEYIQEWAKERGLELISFEGSGSDGGFEPKYRRRW